MTNPVNSRLPAPDFQHNFSHRFLVGLGAGSWALGVCVCALLVVPAHAQQMPDPSQIHGKAIPAAELPAGSVTVRVVRESIGNNISGQPVKVTIGGATKTATTDDQGRAAFDNLPRGEQGRAEATVGGESLVSDPFTVPATGGLRVILVAGIAEAAERKKAEEAKELAAPPTKGVVVIGGNSRILMQFQDDNLRVFYVLDVINNARSGAANAAAWSSVRTVTRRNVFMRKFIGA